MRRFPLTVMRATRTTKKAFVPTIAKGRMDNIDGYLVTYNDICKALEIPPDHWLIDLEDNEPYVTITLLPKRAITRKNGILHISKREPSTTLRHKDLLDEQYGIRLKHYAVQFLVREQGNAFANVPSLPSAFLYTHRKHLYAWFSEDEGYSLQEITIDRRTQ